MTLYQRKVTINKCRVHVDMENKKQKTADSKESNEHIKPAFISFRILNKRNEAFEKAIGDKKIGEYPNMIVKNSTRNVNQQS